MYILSFKKSLYKNSQNKNQISVLHSIKELATRVKLDKKKEKQKKNRVYKKVKVFSLTNFDS